MDKRDLLRSFSKVHGRPILILEQEGEADSLISTARSQNSPLSQPAVGKTPSGKPVGVFITAKGVAKGGLLGGDGVVLGGANQYNLDDPEGLQSFYKLFTDEDTAKRSKKKREAGITLADKLMSFVGATQELIASIQQSFLNMGEAMAQDVNGTFAKMAASMNTTVERLAGYFTGGSPQSLESRLSNLSFKLISKDGSLVKVKSTPDAVSRQKVSDKIENLMQIAMGDPKSATDTQCKEMTKNFAMTGGAGSRSLVVAVDKNINDNDSLAISDPQGVYETLLRTAYKKCGKRKDPEEVSLVSDSTGGANANRGFAFEEVPQILSIMNALREAEASGDSTNAKCLKDQLKDSSDTLFKKLNKLTEDTEGWTESEANTALTLDDQASLDMAKSLVEQAGGSKNKRDFNTKLVRSMIPYSENINNRGSVMALPAGEDTGQGKRQDVLEVFEDCDKAREGLATRGNELGVEPETVKISDLTKDQQKSLKCLQKGKNPKLPSGKDAEVCIINTSLKNYRGIATGITAGSMRGGSQGEVVNIVDANFKGELDFGSDLSVAEKRQLEDYQAELSEIEARMAERRAGAKGLAVVGADDRKDQERAKRIRANVRKIENRVSGARVTAERVLKAEEMYKERLGLSDEDYRAAADILKDQSDMNNFIINNPKVNVTLSDGKVLDNYDVFNTVGEIALDKLNDMLDIEEGSAAADELKQLVEDHRDEPSEKARRKLSTFIEKQSLMAKIEAGDRNAINALKLKMMRVGGDSTDKLGLEIRDIDNRLSYGFKHNQPLEDAFNSIGQPDSEWKIDGGSPGSSDITLVHPTFGKIKLEARTINKGSGNYTTQYSVHYDKKVIESYNKYARSRKDESKLGIAFNLITEALNVIKEKVRVLDANKI